MAHACIGCLGMYVVDAADGFRGQNFLSIPMQQSRTFRDRACFAGRVDKFGSVEIGIRVRVESFAILYEYNSARRAVLGRDACRCIESAVYAESPLCWVAEGDPISRISELHRRWRGESDLLRLRRKRSADKQ